MSSDLTTPPNSDPAQILRYRDRQYAAELMATAIVHHDFFTWLKDNEGASNSEICAHFDFAARPADVLLTLCRANGFLTADNRLTDAGREHLVAESPWFLGHYYSPIADTPIVQDFLKVLKTGKPANWQAKDGAGDWHESMLEEDFAKSFTELMNCRGLAFGQVLAEKLKPQLADRSHVLDVGGGSGIYSSTMVAANPHLRATVFEQSPVDAIVEKEIAKHGLSEKISVAGGDMFSDPWPTDADVILLSNVLHDWDFPEVRQLLEKSATAMSSGDLIIIHEAFINDQKTGPLPVAEYSALIMNITQGKCYAPCEYGEILTELGFDVGPYVDTIADRGFMTAVKR